jgi:hypothetical protein
MNQQREPGFYWVRGVSCDVNEVAELTGGRFWLVVGDKQQYDDCDFAYISPEPITPPETE